MVEISVARKQRVIVVVFLVAASLLVLSNVLYSFRVPYNPTRFWLDVAGNAAFIACTLIAVAKYRLTRGVMVLLVMGAVLSLLGILLNAKAINVFAAGATGLDGSRFEVSVHQSVSDVALCTFVLALVLLCGDAARQTARAEAQAVQLRDRDQRLRTLVHDIEAILWEADPGPELPRFTFVSPRAEVMLGYPVERWLNELDFWVAHIHPDDRERTVRICREATDASRDHELAYRFVAADGRIVWLHDIVRVVQDDDGRRHLRGLIVDITERKEAEAALRASEERYRAVFEQAADAIVVIDADTATVVEFNDRAHEQLGYTREEFAALKLADIDAIESADDVAKRIERIAHVGSDVFETKHRTKDGAIRNVLVSVRMLAIPGRRLMGGLFRDITDQKGSSAEIEQYRQHLEELVKQRTRELETSREQLRRSERLASIGTLAAGIAHEINNPVQAMLSAARAGQRSRGQSNQDTVMESALSLVVRQAERCGRIVKGVLQFARQRPTEKWPTDPNEIAWRAVDLSRPYAEDRGAKLDLQLGEDLPYVRLNPIGMEQALINLIRNAIEASDRPVHVTVRTCRVGDVVRFVVQDDGPGISEAYRGRIFDPFYTGRERQGGTGLGLSVTHGIVNDHGGKIDVQSRSEGGTTMSIDLPLAGVDEAATIRTQPE